MKLVRAVASLAVGIAVGAGATVAVASGATQTATAPTIQLEHYFGPVGLSLMVNGSGFPVTTSVAVYVDEPSSYVATPARINGPGLKTDAAGSFGARITIPGAAYGLHNVCADTGYPGSSGGQPVKACALFGVEASVWLSPESGPFGTPVTVHGAGFPAGGLVGFYADDPWQTPGIETPGRTIEEGGFTARITMPPRVPSPHNVCARVVSTNTNYTVGCAVFRVTGATPIPTPPTVALSPDSGPPGTQVTMHASGFRAFTPYVLTLDQKLLVCPETAKTYPYEYITDASGQILESITLQLHMRPTQCPPGSGFDVAYGKHPICVLSGGTEACQTFDLVGPSQPAAGASGLLNVAGPPRTAIALTALLVLVLLAAGAIWSARQLRK